MTTRSHILHAASCVLDDFETPDHELHLKQLVEDGGVRQELGNGLATEAVGECSSKGGYTRLLSILVIATLQEVNAGYSGNEGHNSQILDSLCRGICQILLDSSTNVDVDNELANECNRLFSSEIGENIQVTLILIKVFLNISRIPVDLDNHGIYIPALLLAKELHQNMPDTKEKVGSEHLLFDIVQRLARNMFPGGDRCSTFPSHVFLSRRLLQDVNKHSFQTSILPPLRLKLFNSFNKRRVRTLNTVEALIISLDQCEHGEYFHDYLNGKEGGTNFVTRMVDDIIDGGESEDLVLAATNVLCALVHAVPVKGLISASDALLNTWEGEDDKEHRVSFALGKIASLFDDERKRNTISTNEQWMSRAYTVLAASPQHGSNSTAVIEKWKLIYDSLRNETQLISMTSFVTGNSSAAKNEDRMQCIEARQHGEVNPQYSIQDCDDRATQETLDIDKRIADNTVGKMDSIEAIESKGFFSAGPCNTFDTSFPRSKGVNDNIEISDSNGTPPEQLENLIRTKTLSFAKSPIEINSDRFGDRIRGKLQSASGARVPILNETQTISESLNERVDEKLRITNPDGPLPNIHDSEAVPPTTLYQKLYEKKDMVTSFTGGLDDSHLSDQSSTVDEEMDEVSSDNREERMELPVSRLPPSNHLSETAAFLNSDRDLSDKTEIDYVSDDESNLIIATAINDNDEEMKLPQCEEYDPATRTRFKRRMKTWICISLLVAIIVAIPVGVVLSKKGTKPIEETVEITSFKTEVPSFSPTIGLPTTMPSFAPTGVDHAYLAKIITYVFGDDKEYWNIESSYGKAFDWISNDAFSLKGISEKGIHDTTQRFFFALFYYDLGGDRWSSCSALAPDFNCTYIDKDGIVIEGQNKWLGSYHICSWAGLVCYEGKTDVMEIDLNQMKLNGTIPDAIQHLSSLETLSLIGNNIYGQIPKTLGHLLKLVDVDIHSNELIGTIPDEIFDLTRAINLNLGYNNLNGTLSASIGALTSMKGLHVSNNHLSGPIPTEIGLLGSTLDYLSLGDNKFDSELPIEMQALTNLKELYLNSNQFTGQLQLPSALDLRFLHLANNQFSGTLPENLYTLPNLLSLHVGNNMFSGELKSEIGMMSKLELMTFRENRLSGTIPSEIDTLQHLHTLRLHRNNLSGTVPVSICNLFSNSLNQFYADCKNDLDEKDDFYGNGLPELTCICCTDCCNPGPTGSCSKRD